MPFDVDSYMKMLGSTPDLSQPSAPPMGGYGLSAPNGGFGGGSMVMPGDAPQISQAPTAPTSGFGIGPIASAHGGYLRGGAPTMGGAPLGSVGDPSQNSMGGVAARGYTGTNPDGSVNVNQGGSPHQNWFHQLMNGGQSQSGQQMGAGGGQAQSGSALQQLLHGLLSGLPGQQQQQPQAHQPGVPDWMMQIFMNGGKFPTPGPTQTL